MGIVFLAARQRRAIVFGALVVVLHAALFSFVAGTVALPRLPMANGMRFVQARLLPTSAPPAPAPVALPLPAAPPLAPPPLPQLPVDSLPTLAEEAGAGTATDGSAPAVPEAGVAPLAATITAPGPEPASATAPATASGTASATASATASGTASATASGTAPGTASASAPGTPAEAAPAARRYQVDVPPPATITLAVTRVDADGTRWSGEAQLGWTMQGERYRIDYEAGIRVVFARVNLAVLSSEGKLAATGFEPVTMTEKRRGRSLTATHFDAAKEHITFSSAQKAVALLPGAQDKASVPLQLAAIARADPRQFDEPVEIQVGEERDAVIYRFTLVGTETLDTPLGRLQALHLTRPPKEGSYRSRLDIWLAPAYGALPVQIRNTEANGAVTTQTVNNIALIDTGK